MPGKSLTPSWEVNSSACAIPLWRGRCVKDTGDAAPPRAGQLLHSKHPTEFARTRARQSCVPVSQLTTSPGFAASHLAAGCSAQRYRLTRTPAIHVAISCQHEMVAFSYPEQPAPVPPVNLVRVFPAQSTRIAGNGGDNVAAYRLPHPPQSSSRAGEYAGSSATAPPPPPADSAPTAPP